MKIKQFYDDALAHASYAVVSEGEMALVDPARDPDPYLKYSREENVMITAVIETHPHADFVSSHKEISKITGAPVYVSRLLGADYPHETFDSGDFLRIGKVTLHAFNTPGHSPDSISIVVKDEHGKDHSVFTGDTLFIGDVGRPDLRENTGNITAKREELARQMYHSTRDILMKLGQDVVIYPAHGAGSLCGKAISRELSSTLGRQLRENYALQDMKEDDFVKVLLEDQPFIPKYFSFDVEMNKSGADEFEKNIKNVPRLKSGEKPESGTLVVDTRSKESFNMGHIPGSFHIIEDGKFETWLGAIVGPNEPYYLVGEDEKSIESIIRRAAKIGYEKMIRG
ncbi:MAG TPA: MBL fold metallo-hydrolase, partial [Cyclobacteriaceae bacterium]|nr:MBL fold metallo-hydrolase [Cyclobacteriaceae bacterium]